MAKADYRILAGALRHAARHPDQFGGEHPDVAALRAAYEAAHAGARAGFVIRHIARVVAARQVYLPPRPGHPRPLAALAARERYLALVRARLAAPAAPPPTVVVPALAAARREASAALAAARVGGR